MLSDGPAYCLFDSAVNQGVKRAAKMMQKAVGVTVDGKIGPQTAAAVNADASRAVALFQFERARHYTSLKTFGRFGRGWISNRVADVGIKALTD